MSELNLEVRSDLGDLEVAYLALEQEVSQSYYGFLCDSPADARRWQEGLFRTANCEFGPPWARALVVSGTLAGMYSAIPGAQLARMRLLSGLATLRSQRSWGDAMIERLRLAGKVSLQPSSEDFYLSRFGISSNLRGRGLGLWLLRWVLADAARLGLNRCVLEVDPENVAAIRLYERAGFEAFDEREVVEPAGRRRWARLSMGRSVPSLELADQP